LERQSSTLWIEGSATAERRERHRQKLGWVEVRVSGVQPILR
jgi:hypothetical protein